MLEKGKRKSFENYERKRKLSVHHIIVTKRANLSVEEFHLTRRVSLRCF
jgi:hypothetical protein